MCHIGGILHQNISRIVLFIKTPWSVKIQFLKQYIFEGVISRFGLDTLSYVTLCHLFGQFPPPRRVTHYLNGPYGNW